MSNILNVTVLSVIFPFQDFWPIDFGFLFEFQFKYKSEFQFKFQFKFEFEFIGYLDVLLPNTFPQNYLIDMHLLSINNCIIMIMISCSRMANESGENARFDPYAI